MTRGLIPFFWMGFRMNYCAPLLFAQFLDGAKKRASFLVG